MWEGNIGGVYDGITYKKEHRRDNSSVFCQEGKGAETKEGAMGDREDGSR